MNDSDLLVRYSDVLTMIIIGILVIALFMLLIYITFFAVRIKGAEEEGDDVYDLLKLGLLRFRNGAWSLKLGNSFNENAVIKVDFGPVYLRLFEGWELEGISTGEKSGIVKNKVSKNTTLLKRKVRRS